MRAAAAVFALVLAGCASAPPAVPAPTHVPTASTTLPNDLKWVRDSAEYHALVLQAYRAATARVERSVEPASSRARGGWAVVLDADETGRRAASSCFRARSMAISMHTQRTRA